MDTNFAPKSRHERTTIFPQKGKTRTNERIASIEADKKFLIRYSFASPSQLLDIVNKNNLNLHSTLSLVILTSETVEWN